MEFREYRNYDAIGLAKLVADKAVTPLELLETACARLDQVNGALNAVNTDVRDRARTAISDRLPDGPLKGVPFLLKDLGLLMRGVPTCSGSRLFKDSAPAAADSALVAAYRKAGLVIFGKTNTPEFGISAATESLAFGATRNPWDLSRTPGGSSGGSAAAVAAGIIPACHGGDGGGSIRIPAACCNLFGFKPSRGRVSNSPLGDAACGPGVNHVLTRTVRDSALLLDISCESVSGDFCWLAPPATPFLDEVERETKRLRIGYVPAPMMWHEIDEEVRAATAEAARFCEALGHDVEETTMPADFHALRDAIAPVYLSNLRSVLLFEAKRRGREITRNDIEEVTFFSMEEGRDVKGTDVAEAYMTYYAIGQAFAAIFDKYDVLLQATVGQLPVPIGALRTSGWPNRTAYTDALYSFMCNTQPYNTIGAPAMSVPLATAKNGLPIGIHFAARPGNDGLLFRLAGQLERARPWFGRVPPEFLS